MKKTLILFVSTKGLPYIVQTARFELPQYGKDIIYYDDWAADAPKHTLHWTGTWFEE